MCRAGARDTYEESSADLLAYAGIAVSAQKINRMVHRIGPGMREEMEAEIPTEHTQAVPRLYRVLEVISAARALGENLDGDPKEILETKINCTHSPIKSKKAYTLEAFCVY